jgi:hypothetical protein
MEPEPPSPQQPAQPPHLFIPWIAYNHTVNMQHALSMMRLVLHCQAHGIRASLYPIGFESLVSRARNAGAAAFLSEPTATHLLFIDADIEFSPEDVLALLRADRPIACGAYAKKYIDRAALARHPDRLELCTQPSIHFTPAAEAAILGAPPGTAPPEIAECTYATTGFLLIAREVFTTLAARHPERRYVNDIDAHGGLNADAFYDLFPVAIHPETRRYESEDYGFSRLARDAGFGIVCVTDLTLTHHGHMGFPCNLRAQLVAATARVAPAESPAAPPSSL